MIHNFKNNIIGIVTIVILSYAHNFKIVTFTIIALVAVKTMYTKYTNNTINKSTIAYPGSDGLQFLAELSASQPRTDNENTSQQTMVLDPNQDFSQFSEFSAKQPNVPTGVESAAAKGKCIEF